MTRRALRNTTIAALWLAAMEILICGVLLSRCHAAAKADTVYRPHITPYTSAVDSLRALDSIAKRQRDRESWERGEVSLDSMRTWTKEGWRRCGKRY